MGTLATTESHKRDFMVTAISSLTWCCLLMDMGPFPDLGTKLSDCGTSALARLPGGLRITPRMFCLLHSRLTTVRLCLLAETRPSSSGTPSHSASTLSRRMGTRTGFPPSGSLQGRKGYALGPQRWQASVHPGQHRHHQRPHLLPQQVLVVLCNWPHHQGMGPGEQESGGGTQTRGAWISTS